MNVKKTASLLVAGAFAFGFALPSFGAVWTLSGSMDPLQAGTNGGFGGGTGSGTGTISGTYDDDTNVLNYLVTWSGLSTPETVAHFHLGAPGVSGAPTLGFTATSPASGSSVLSASQEIDLLAGNWYANVHTSAFPGGEIRGQVIVTPEPSSLALLGLGGLLVARRRRR